MSEQASAPRTTSPNGSGPLGVSLTALIPCYNESAAVDAAYREITAALAGCQDLELLFVDDGSSDDTLERIKRLAHSDTRVRYLVLARNYGLAAASSAGFKYASKDWTVQFDADLQSPAAEAGRLLAKAMEGYDAVFAVRANRQDPWLRRVGSSAANWVAKRLLGIELPIGAWSFRVVRTAVAKKLVAVDVPLPYFIATLPRLSARYATVPTPHRRREGGPSKFSLRRLMVLSIELFFGFSYRPLALLPVLACGGLVIGVLAAILAVFGWLDRGWLGFLALAVGLLALLDLTVVAGYLLRIAEAQRRLARFYVREANLPVDPCDDLYEHERSRVGIAG